ncbi:hypothetical protein BLNAU_4000 [Blattamonas nauphoetae]|uniref:DNA2/NAM7 helicase helicase domain-containing protein n=1 Tax=Blattamonas nauphoetae TaxID=2049346 RepID=A0ABQ9YAW4_9EUKA|nr:hypothetical protein BLNAU_4000 [Blattamonas nauphoetae]
MHLRLVVIPSEIKIRTVIISRPDTIADLSDTLANALKTPPQHLILLFPSIPPQDANIQRPLLGEKGPGIVIANASDADGVLWKGLVGESGCRYTYHVRMDDLLRRWPVLDDNTGMAPITVISLSDGFCSSFRMSDNQLEETLTTLDMMFQLYYTKPERRCLKLPVAEDRLQEFESFYVRDDWDVFVRGIIRKFAKMSNFTPPTQPPNPNFPLFPENGDGSDELTEDEINAVPRELLDSIRQVPSCNDTESAVNAYQELFDRNRTIDNVFLKGQPGTGKSQMLLYLIYRLMHSLEKVAILYTPSQMSLVLTVLIDHTHPTSPINVRVHKPTFAEDTFTKDFEHVIRIVDSEDPFKDPKMDRYFTVFVASQTQFSTFRETMRTDKFRIELSYPLWRQDEFLKMLVRLGKTEHRFWHHNLSARSLCKMHPLVVKLLGTHGQYIAVDRKKRKGSVEMNVIDIFGLTPRMLGPYVDDMFLDLMKTLEFGTFETSEVDSLVPLRRLVFTEDTGEPVSLFASRLLLIKSSNRGGLADAEMLEGRDVTPFDPTSDEFIDCLCGQGFNLPLPNLESVMIREPASMVNSDFSEFVATLERTHLSSLQPSSIQSGQIVNQRASRPQ